MNIIIINIIINIPNCGTFILGKEDHTIGTIVVDNIIIITNHNYCYSIGNLIRIQLLRDPQVRFAGYKMPHPLG